MPEENIRINVFRVFFAAQDQATARPRNVLCVVVVTKSAMFHRAGMDSAATQAGDVRECLRADTRRLAGDFPCA